MPQIRFGSFSYWHLVLIFAAAKLLVHGFTAENYELHRDALLYLAQGEHPDAGYWSVPPLTALLGRLFRFLFGDSTLAVRLLPATAGAVSMLIIGDAVRRLGGKIPAGILAMSAFLLSGAYLRTNSLYQPVALDQMFWLLVLYLYLRLLLSRDPRWWIVLSLALGAGLLTKYSIAILGLGSSLPRWQDRSAGCSSAGRSSLRSSSG
jgi:4-amino-4-deoxy-L-arabinose transferase-like glycosyltransferase